MQIHICTRYKLSVRREQTNVCQQLRGIDSESRRYPWFLQPGDLKSMASQRRRPETYPARAETAPAIVEDDALQTHVVTNHTY